MKASFVIAACLAAAVPLTAQAMPNPASTFCAAMQGRSVDAKLPDGSELGLCELPNRKIVEAWTLFRMMGGKVPAPVNNPFR